MDKIAKNSHESSLLANDVVNADTDADFKPLSAQEAGVWRSKQPQMSLWRIVGWQACATCVAGLLAGVLTGYWQGTLSALYGGLAVLAPTAVMVWGMTARRWSRVLAAFAKGSLVALAFWEGVKVTLSVTLLALAPVLLNDLNWLALVASFVLVIKVYWLALFVQSKTA
jgi:ATP synthase protein I